MKLSKVTIYLRNEEVEVFEAVSNVDVSEGVYVTVDEVDGAYYLFPHSQIKYITVQPN